MNDHAQREWSVNAAASKTLSRRGNSLRENRQTPAIPTAGGGVGRSAKATSHTADRHVAGESDGLIVPTKRTTKAGPPTAAESAEGRGPTKGNVLSVGHAPDPAPGLWVDRREGVRRVARQDQKVRLTARLHQVTPPRLSTSFQHLKREARPGVEDVTGEEDGGEGLRDRLHDLHDRGQRGTYRAQPSKRAWIPKADGRLRPLGSASLEDKIVQPAIRTVLAPIDEEDFVGFSYGFRLGRSPHNARDALGVGLTERTVNGVLDADLRGFFDAIDHDWRMKFIAHRMADRRILRLIRQWLRAGVSDEGPWSPTTGGTPQGAVIAPLLAKVLRHDVLDLGVQPWRTKHAPGEGIFVRYADDFVMGFPHRCDAERCLQELRGRFTKFGLERHPDKTRLIEFGRLAAERRAKRGLGKPETFDFLGFTPYGGTTRKGMLTLTRHSAAKRMRAKRPAIQAQLRRFLHFPVAEVGRWRRSVVQGWFHDRAVPGHSFCLDPFRTQVGRPWLAVLRRRRQRGCRWRWERMSRWLRCGRPPARILHPYPHQRWRVRHPRSAPYEVMLHVRSRAGGAGQPASLPRP